MSSSAPSPHRIHRHPAAPWAALRVSVGTRDCYRPHSHPEYSVGIVDEGGATFHHPSGPQPVQAGSVVLIEPQVVHACNPAAGQPWSYRMLFVDAAWLHAAVARVWGLAQAPQGLHFASRAVDDPAVSAVVDRLCQPITDAAAAQALAQALPRWLAGRVVAGPPQDAAPVPDELRPAIAAMQHDTGQRLTVRALAQACGMSAPRFIRRFQAVFGLTPGSYLQNQRLNGARRLLAQGSALADTAQAMGFADQAHLQRSFKAHHAMTPGDYRPPRR